MRLPANCSARYAIGFAIGCLIFIGIPEGARWLHGGAFGQTTPPIAGQPPNVSGTGNIVTWGQSGGNNTIINSGERIANVGLPTIAAIKEHLPPGAKVMILKMINDGPSAQLEGQFKRALSENGYSVVGSGIAFGDLFNGFTIDSKPNGDGVYILTIGDPRL
jgi:hypothetical protein